MFKTILMKALVVFLILVACIPAAVGIVLATVYSNYLFLLYGLITVAVLGFTCIDVKLEDKDVHDN